MATKQATEEIFTRQGYVFAGFVFMGSWVYIDENDLKTVFK